MDSEHDVQVITSGFKGDNMIIEIRAAEGGDDAKLLVADQFEIYRKLGVRRCL